MERKKLRRTAIFAVLWLLLLAVVLTSATYAWFTFTPDTNVTPMAGTVSQGDTYLLISNSPSGGFDTSCTMPQSVTAALSPVSTPDLTRFYTATVQNREGISIEFADTTDCAEESLIHGTLYLQCKSGGCDVYLYRSGLTLGGDAQTLAALRLGMKLTTAAGTQTYMFNLDALGDTAGAATRRTVPNSGTVVSALTDGAAVYAVDPAVTISDYFASEQTANDPAPGAGRAALCTLREDEICTVEYWLYLEGCDDNCIREVQSKDVALQLAFAGVSEE